MFLGYNTNGLAHHDLFDAVELLAEIGYLGVEITIDHGAFSPRDADWPRQAARLRGLLDKHGMRSVIETGARFLLDPREKHEPTLMSVDRRRRIEFYKHAIDCAAALGSDCVSIWSGAIDEKRIKTPDPLYYLIEGLRMVLDYAAAKDVTVAFEPEPGMFIDSMAGFEELTCRLDDDRLRLTLDIGHAQCQGETPIAELVRRWAPRLANVHVEDMRRGRHEHLMFGEGEIDFPPIFHALQEVGYPGGVYVELSRHGHEGPAAARRAMRFLQAML
jgi:sugar phosphate isomerase/epimerase